MIVNQCLGFRHFLINRKRPVPLLPSLYHKIRWFNIVDFISKEYKLASNIKDRSNRQSVERVLKTLLQIKTFKNTSNGLCCVAGIDSTNKEFIHINEPIVPITKFIYNCGNKIDKDMISELFNTSTSNGYIVMISGDMTFIYTCILNNDISFKLSNKIIGLLNKRMSRGGMSQNRIARLAEDSRLHYTTRIVEAVNKLTSMMLNSKEEIYLVGSREISNMVVECKTLIKPVKILDKWHSWKDPYDVLINNKKELLTLFQHMNDKDEKKIQSILELVKKDPDWLLFGQDIKNCEYIITCDPNIKGDNVLFVEHNSKYYVVLKPYISIGKKYYKNEL